MASKQTKPGATKPAGSPALTHKVLADPQGFDQEALQASLDALKNALNAETSVMEEIKHEVLAIKGLVDFLQ